MNKAVIYTYLDRLEDAYQAYQLSQNTYHADEILADAYILWGTYLFYKLGKRNQYEDCKKHVLNRLEQMYTVEYLEVCRVLFDCGLDPEDYELVQHVFSSMEQYLSQNPTELRIGVKIQEFQPFVQAKDSARSTYTGTGLGMAIVE